MVWEHQCTKCNSTSCQHRTPLAVTFIYDKHWGLSWNILQPARCQPRQQSPLKEIFSLSYPFRDSQGSDRWRVTHLGRSKARRRGAPKSLLWSWWRCRVCRLPAPSLLLRCSLQSWLQIYTNAMSKLLNCNIKQPAESVTSTMRPGIFMEVLTFSGNGLCLLGNWFWLDTWLIDQDKYHKFWVVKSKQTGFWTKETSLGF